MVSSCWHFMPPAAYAVALAAAVGAWNRAHPSVPLSLSAYVNLTRHSTFAGKPTTTAGQAEDNSPISVALNYAAMKYDAKGNAKGFLSKPGATATIRTPSPAAVKLASLKSPPKTAPAPVKLAGVKAPPLGTLLTASKAATAGSSGALTGIAFFGVLGALALLLRR